MADTDTRIPQPGEIWQHVDYPLLTVRVERVEEGDLDTVVTFTFLTSDTGHPMNATEPCVSHLHGFDVGATHLYGFADLYTYSHGGA